MKTFSNQFRVNRIQTILILLITFSSLNISAQYFEWAKQFGGPTGGDQPYSMAYDANGNLYMTGLFRDTSDFDPGPGVFNLISNGGIDLFIVKVNASGNLIWAKNVGGTGTPGGGWAAEDNGLSIAVGPSGSVYVGGFFTDTVDFDPGSGVFNMVSAPNTGTACANARDGFILKLNASGNFVWAKQIGGSGFDAVNVIALGASETVHVVGTFMSNACSTDPVDLNPGTATFYATGGGGYYLVKLDSGGAFVWADVFPEWSTCFSPCGAKTTDIRIATVHLDGSGNIYCAGSLVAAADFDPGPGTYTLTPVFGPTPYPPGDANGYVLKLNSSGGFIWAKPLGGGYSDIADVDVDANGNVFSTGSFWGTVDFDPGASKKNLTSVGGNGDILVWKLKSSGSYSWAGQMGGGQVQSGISIDLDSDDNVYTAGTFLTYSSPTDFDPAKTKYLLSSAGNYDAFVSKLSNTGGFIWAVAFGGSGLDVARAMVVDALDNVFTSGWFSSTADFDPGSGTYNMTVFGTTGKTDAFLQKMNQGGGGAKWEGNNAEATGALTLFPNPTTGELTLLSDVELTDAVIRLFNSAGQLIASEKGISGRTYSLSLSAQPSGMYFVEIGNDGHVTRMKVVKQ